MDDVRDRLERVEGTLQGEEDRYREREIRNHIKVPRFRGKLHESVEEFANTITRYMQLHRLTNASVMQLMPDFLEGSALEYFRSLTQEQQANWEACRPVLTEHFTGPTRTIAASEQFYGRDMRASESIDTYFCCLKDLARLAFHNLPAADRDSQVLTRFRRGLTEPLRTHM